MIVQSILQVGVNSADSTEFTGPVEYLITFSTIEHSWSALAVCPYMGVTTHALPTVVFCIVKDLFDFLNFLCSGSAMR